MSSSGTFRTGLIALALAVAGYSVASAFAEISTADRVTFPQDQSKITAPSEVVQDWLEKASPFRSDIENREALVLALQTLQRGKPAGASNDYDRARSRLRHDLSVTPYDSRLWLVLAMLEAQRDPKGPATVEALRMAYLTAPNDAQLMPARLDTAVLTDALADPDMREFARGDLRLMLTRQPDQKTAVLSAYRRASNEGKAFLDEAVRSIDPAFLPRLGK